MPPTSLVRLAVAAALVATLGVAQARDAPPSLEISLDSKPAAVSSDAALVVTAKVGWRGKGGSGEKVWTRRGDAVEARLRYRAMWGEEKSVPMRLATGSIADDARVPYATLAAAIPANELPKRGEMVRYWVTVSERGGARARARKPKREDEFYGAVVDADAIARETTLPTLHWFVEDAEGARWDTPTPSFLAFDQSRRLGERKLEFYGKGVTARRRGSGRRGDPNMWGKGGTKDWPKRKYKFDFRGRDFEIAWGDGDRSAKVEEINAHSAYEEPGSESWLRETLAAAAMRRLGVPASAAQHVVLRRNGAFHGLYVLVEQVDDAFLERRGLDPRGALFKAVHWKLSNLRPPAPEWAPCRYDRDWDLEWGACPEVYRYSAPSKYATDDHARDAEWHLGELLDAIARVNGGDGDGRDALYAAVDVDAVAREMAAQTTMLHQDRCTKNYYVYRNPRDGKWRRVPWDLEDAFATDYRSRDARCDANGATSCRADRGTYCVLSCEWWNSPFFCDENHPQDVFTESDGRSTWNHLVNAVLKVPSSRAAYFRELRRAMALLHDDGWLEREARKSAAAIAPDATRDAKKWGLNEPGVGAEALLRQIRERRDTLTNEYGRLWRNA